MPQERSNDVAEALVDFARALSGSSSVESVLHQLSESCTRLLPVTGVGVLLLEDGELTVGTTNSPEGEAVETLEVGLGSGPCVDSVRTGQPNAVPDLAAATDRYPEFAPKAVALGIRSVYALPLTGRSELIGALDIIHREPLDLRTEDLATAQMLADVAVSYILAVRLHEESTRLASQLQRALDTRVVIEQAKGVLAERHGESVIAAFERLRRHARSNNETVRDVAVRLVAGELRI